MTLVADVGLDDVIGSRVRAVGNALGSDDGRDDNEVVRDALGTDESGDGRGANDAAGDMKLIIRIR